jgi:H+/Cl- antiporter ClcA
VLLTILFGSLSVTIAILRSVFNWDRPFAALYRMYEYHNEHPLQYIAIVSVVFGIVGSRWIDRYHQTTNFFRWWTMTVAILLTIVISSPLGGILWQIHDMQHGFIPENYPGKLYLRNDVRTSIGFTDLFAVSADECNWIDDWISLTKLVGKTCQQP